MGCKAIQLNIYFYFGWVETGEDLCTQCLSACAACYDYKACRVKKNG